MILKRKHALYGLCAHVCVFNNNCRPTYATIPYVVGLSIISISLSFVLSPPGGEDVAEALAHELIRRMLGAAGGGATENAGDVLDDFMDAMSPEKRKVREAEHLADIGMHNVYVQNIKRW